MSGPERMPCAAAAAETGSRWWALAARTQRTKRGDTVDHADLYGLAGEVVATLRALDELAGVLARQTAYYGVGRALRDDEGADPAERIDQAASAADALGADVVGAARHANAYWSAIGHIGLDLRDEERPEGGTP